jgi:hypothetical protein
MKRFVALLTLAWLEIAGNTAAHAETFSELSLGRIAMLRQTALAEAWSEYVRLAEFVIEKSVKEMPVIARKAADHYQKLPGILHQLKDHARETGGRGIEITAGMGLDQLDAAIEEWITHKSASMEAELHLASTNLKIAHKAVEPISALVGERERKQQVIAQVIVLMVDVLNEQAKRDQDQRDLDLERGKRDKLEPTAIYTPMSDRIKDGRVPADLTFINPAHAGVQLETRRHEAGFRLAPK